MKGQLVYSALLLYPWALSAQEMNQVHVNELVSPIASPFVQVNNAELSSLNPDVSLPLSIVNMPVTLGITHKALQHNNLTGLVSLYHSVSTSSQETLYTRSNAEFNADVKIAVEPLDGMTLALSQSQTLQQDRFGIVNLGVNQDLNSSTKLGFSYNWQDFSFQTDLELEKQNYLEQAKPTQYWRVGGEVRAKDWLYLRAGVHHDLEKTHDDTYYIGTGISFSRSLNLDITGMYGDDNDFGGLLQTSYHF